MATACSPTSEGQCVLSWIWKMNLQGGEKGLQEGWSISSFRHLLNTDIFILALHIEWCKSHAHAQRWQEECDLLMEEMHHVEIMFQPYSDLWVRQAEQTALPGPKAYTFRQAAMWSDLHSSAATQWKEMMLTVSETSTDDFNPTINVDLHNP